MAHAIHFPEIHINRHLKELVTKTAYWMTTVIMAAASFPLIKQLIMYILWKFYEVLIMYRY
ncbi:MAG TPA: hypothetical protein VM802_09390 [Chitinophaga sp.]|uniref:hypothetical protein n=1 Tax=Chitinophaga sp. TaxID=1869181 RepID=UPI002C95A2DE|nr:hypothetical protein [Chitinophaga sp.]HVI45074.1 hypothetical protein [Chitinophaga sp.]